MENPSDFEKVNNFLFWKNIILVGVFLVVTPITLATSMFTLMFLDTPKDHTPHKVVASETTPGVQVFASLPSSFPAIGLTAEVSDARVEIVRQYLEYYKSPMVMHAADLVAASDHYKIDFRWLPAIAQQESNVCKIIPEGTYNCWGWGIHSAGTLGFNSYVEGAWTVAKGLKEEYIDKGYTTPELVMSKYTPSSKGSWAAGVNQFMSEMQ